MFQFSVPQSVARPEIWLKSAQINWVLDVEIMRFLYMKHKTIMRRSSVQLSVTCRKLHLKIGHISSSHDRLTIDPFSFP